MEVKDPYTQHQQVGTKLVIHVGAWISVRLREPLIALRDKLFSKSE